WYSPVRQMLGSALLQAERYAEAEQVYREDLKRYPENGWSLYGLSQSLESQGQTAEAQAVRERYQTAWQHADVALTASRF
ncbi:MAG TPA: tetratricopeptide repeat protein, partial [Allocoleopsis sp.]